MNRPVGDDVTFATVLITEAILRLNIDPPISHNDLKASLQAVLDENATTIHLVPVRPAPVGLTIADATAVPQRGAGVGGTIADATQPRIRRGAA